MQSFRLALLVCLPSLAIATAIGSSAAQAADTDPNAAAVSKTMTLEFHPLRAGAASKRTGGSLKPIIDTAAPLAVNASLHMHVHADGAVSYGCSEKHADASAAASAEPPR